MQIVPWIVAIGVGLFAFDRLALWAEAKGWIYWRKKKASTGALGSALMEMNVIANPSAEHVIVVKDAKKFEERQNGDDDPLPR
jgi:hypothetical protein